METRDEMREWATRHEAAWEIAPLLEGVKGQGREQTGFELRIYAQLRDGSDEEAVAAAAQARRVASEVVARPGSAFELEIGSYEDGEVERPETGFADEVVVPVTLTFKDLGHPPRPEEDAQALSAIEAELGSLGLKPRAWDSVR